jgi:hypothetical protein
MHPGVFLTEEEEAAVVAAGDATAAVAEVRGLTTAC